MSEKVAQPLPDGGKECFTPVIFHVVGNNRYSLQIEAERPFFDNNGQAHIIPAKVVTFENCVYEAKNPEEVRLIRESGAYKRKQIFEPEPGDKPQKVEQKAARGVVDTGTFVREGNKNHPRHAVTLTERLSHACDVKGCGKSFKDKKSLHMHNMGKHRKRAPVKARMK